ncbi:hypothetical protein [Hymenobacter volaticus]|uniref:Outer membrane protein beta-barrel domain-containing protein n=1 Tax=Hymenobacter volaticus TaxID=2932254 RepID=A0ABY4GF78_9BACT|nr:hypothetical protein [Hymenobacter volaticus]UOQ69597.1 hypothetical protein MUN86_29255 [Hymenobacter volaticus]
MKLLLFCLAFLTTPVSMHAQERVIPVPRSPRYEVGVEALNYRPFSSSQWKGLTGGFVRYTRQRFGLRAAVNARHKTTQTPEYCADCAVGETQEKTLKLGVGAQYALLSHHPWLYTFLDVYYRRNQTTGSYTGGLCGCLDYTFTSTRRGGGAQTGVGAQIHPIRYFTLSPELYYEGFVARAQSLNQDHRTGATTRRTWSETGHLPALRILATVAF